MERLPALIHKLKEQFEENVPPAQMLGTVRQLESELSQLAAVATANTVANRDTRPTNGLGTAKVAVMMPSGMRQGQTAPTEPTQPVEETRFQPQPKELY